MKKTSLAGVSTALITPFKNGEVDFTSLKKLLRQQLDGGIEGFVVGGTTAEAATLSLAEKKDLLDFVISEVGGAVPVLMGSGTFNTAETCDLVRMFEKQGPDGFLVVTPYYNRPPQRGLVAHFSAVAEATKLPLIIYNVPSRTGCTILPETVAEIASRHRNVVGVKEAAGQLEIIKKLKTLCPPEFFVLSGDDATYLQAVDLGGQGVISVISHVIPRWCVQACVKAREHQDVEKMTQEVSDIATLLFCESNPIPVKWALQKMGIVTSCELRLPLVELAPEHQEAVRSCLEKWKAL